MLVNSKFATNIVNENTECFHTDTCLNSQRELVCKNCGLVLDDKQFYIDNKYRYEIRNKESIIQYSLLRDFKEKNYYNQKSYIRISSILHKYQYYHFKKYRNNYIKRRFDIFLGRIYTEFKDTLIKDHINIMILKYEFYHIYNDIITKSRNVIINDDELFLIVIASLFIKCGLFDPVSIGIEYIKKTYYKALYKLNKAGFNDFARFISLKNVQIKHFSHIVDRKFFEDKFNVKLTFKQRIKLITILYSVSLNQYNIDDNMFEQIGSLFLELTKHKRERKNFNGGKKSWFLQMIKKNSKEKIIFWTIKQAYMIAKKYIHFSVNLDNISLNFSLKQ